jgi:hypothetical protein
LRHITPCASDLLDQQLSQQEVGLVSLNNVDAFQVKKVAVPGIAQIFSRWCVWGIQASATSAAAAIGKDCRLATGNIGRRDRIPSRHVDDGPNLGQEPSRLAWVSTFVNTANHQCRRQVSVRRGTNISVPGHRVAARRLPTTGSCPRHPRSVDAESKISHSCPVGHRVDISLENWTETFSLDVHPANSHFRVHRAEDGEGTSHRTRLVLHRLCVAFRHVACRVVGGAPATAKSALPQHTWLVAGCDQ